MAQPKSWTATDLLTGKLTLRKVTHPDTDSPAIQYEQRYQFLDDADDVLTEIASGRIVNVIEISSLPASIVSAMQTIDAWTYQQALEKEGMQ